MEFAFEGVKVCAENFKSAGGWSFYHASEHSIPHLKAMAKPCQRRQRRTGVDIGEVKAAIGDQVCIIGNVNPIETLLENGGRSIRRRQASHAEGETGRRIYLQFVK